MSRKARRTIAIVLSALAAAAVAAAVLVHIFRKK